MDLRKQSVRSNFGAAAQTYNSSSVVQKEILVQLLDRLKLMSLEVESLLDLGSGTGAASGQLQDLFGKESYVPLDIALPMLKFANQQNVNACTKYVCGDAEALPFKADSFDIVFSASALQWCENTETVFHDCLRVLRTGGLLIFSLFGPDTLQELRACFEQVDPFPRVIPFSDMHVLGDQLVRAGFYAPVMEMDQITVEYSEPLQLLRDLKSAGATNNRQDRSKGLLTQKKLNAVIGEYQKFRLPNGKYPATYEVIYGHAWCAPSTKIHPESKGGWQQIHFDR